MNEPRTVALVTLGCARNEVDSEELAARLGEGGWRVTTDAEHADAVLVNTCGFVDSAKQDSIDMVMALADGGRPVLAVGCLAERYGDQLAAAMPEASAVLSFDDYPDIAARVDDAVAGRSRPAHHPRDRRRLLPLTPVDRRNASPGSRHDCGIDHAVIAGIGDVGEGQNWPATTARAINSWPVAPVRYRLDAGPVAPLKLASGCDRRCAFCAIPSFRGAFVSRLPDELLGEAEWLARRGVRELFLVSENSTSYGKDLGDLRLLEKLLPQLAAVEGIRRIRVSYLQPAEMRPSLVEAIATTPGVAAYFDLSFQHASPPVLRRMRRFGGTERFLSLLDDVRRHEPTAGVRSNVIVGFPGETSDDLGELERFLTGAHLDAVGVFGYSDEDGTEAAAFDQKLGEDVIRRRVERVSTLVDELMSQRAEERIGETVRVLVEQATGARLAGRADHQGPEDGLTIVTGIAGAVGDVVTATVTGSDGVDLWAEATR